MNDLPDFDFSPLSFELPEAPDLSGRVEDARVGKFVEKARVTTVEVTPHLPHESVSSRDGPPSLQAPSIQTSSLQTTTEDPDKITPISSPLRMSADLRGRGARSPRPTFMSARQDTMRSQVRFQSPTGSDRHSIMSASTASISIDRYDVMLRYLFGRCQQSRFFDVVEEAELGVLIRKADGGYAAEPTTLEPEIAQAAERLGLHVALTMSNLVTTSALDSLTPNQAEVVLDPMGTTLPVVNSVRDLGRRGCAVTADHWMALCREERFLLVWSSTVPSIIGHALEIESKLMGLTWGAPVNRYSAAGTPAMRYSNAGTPAGGRTPGTRTPRLMSMTNDMPYMSTQAENDMMPRLSTWTGGYPHMQPEMYARANSMGLQSMGFGMDLMNSRRSPTMVTMPEKAGGLAQVLELNPRSTVMDPDILSEKIGAIQVAIEKEQLGDKVFDPDKESQEAPKRPFLLNHACVIGFAMILVVAVEMACLAKLLQETMLDHKMIRWALLATVPLFSFFSLFFMIVISGSLFQLFGPLDSVRKNSKYYSATAPKPQRHADYELPHVTIQMPVYKEGLTGVIIPTITSCMAAVKHYESKGGTASIFVNDDGMQLVSPELAEARKAFYELNGIGWCARPAHCPKPNEEEGQKLFLRKGQFKKASNMNYCLDFSLRVEEELSKRIQAVCSERNCTQDDLTIDDEDVLYEKARDYVIESDEGRTWAAGDVRVGEIVLIIDSDTRVPEDCLLYGALEMHESPEVALLQHSSGILQVVNNVFENGITYFTNLIYTSIQFAVGNGDCAPFVGHNTFIRWKAIQSISYQEDGQTKFWSDAHVSEDFDVSLRLQMQHFVVRLATYHNGGFKEGVSLTVYDELARWEKYAYGCNELVFNPLVRWPTRGPFTRLFMRFLWSNVKITSKMTILAYIGTYYAIASAIPLTLANYCLVGWFNSDIDQFYITSWKIFVGMAVIFNVLSPLAYAMLRHRLGQATFFVCVWETIKWTPMFLLFFGGLSFHLFKAIFCHFFSIPMEWTTTAKELEASGFRVGLDRVVKDFKWMYLCLILPATAGMIYLGVYAPRGWIIDDPTAIVPIVNQVACHALLPFALGLF